MQRRRRPLAGDVAEREAERRRPARRGSRRSRRRSIGTAGSPPPPRRSRRLARGFGQQRLLDLGGDAHLLLHPRLLERLAIEPRVLDRDRRLRPRASRAPTRVALDSSVPFSRLSRYSTPMRRSSPRASADSTYCTKFSGTQTTLRMPSATVPMCTSAKPAVEQVGDDLASRPCGRLPRESCGWSRRCVSVSVCLSRPRASLNSSVAVGAGEHDERRARRR